MSAIQVIIGGSLYILLSSGQDWGKEEGKKQQNKTKQQGKLMDPAKEISVIMPD